MFLIVFKFFIMFFYFFVLLSGGKNGWFVLNSMCWLFCLCCLSFVFFDVVVFVLLFVNVFVCLMMLLMNVSFLVLYVMVLK